MSGTKELKLWCPQGPHGNQLEVYTDSDWARDPRDRKSVSSVVVVWGGFIIMTLVRGQGAIALSSCEAETYAIASGLSEAIGIRTALEFLGSGQLSIRVRSDASAALAVTQRQGSGRIRHLSAKVMWVQQAVRQSLCKMLKISTHCNLADMGTKPLELKIFLELRRALGLILEVPLPTQRSPQGIYSQVGMSKEEVSNDTAVDIEGMVQLISKDERKVETVLKLISMIDARGS